MLPEETLEPSSPTRLDADASASNTVLAGCRTRYDAQATVHSLLRDFPIGGFLASPHQLGQALRNGEVDRLLLARVLIGSVETHLGRAALFAGRADLGQRLLECSVRHGVPGGASRSLDLMTAEAERCRRLGDDREAIQRWQDIACLLGEWTPEYVYRQMSAAYTRNNKGFGGTAAENHLWGDCHKHAILAWLQKQLQPSQYLEIGVDQGLSLALAYGKAIGVDPRPELSLKKILPPAVRILPMSSDAFFREAASTELIPKPELVFIDGMHLFEFALRDLINVERYAAPQTLVVIDDIYPCHPLQASRRRKTGSWTGDIWKLHAILREVRPDLTLIALNAFTTGLLLIAGLDPANEILVQQYDRLVLHYAEVEQPPESVIVRHGAIPSSHPVVIELVNQLKQGSDSNASVEDVRAALSKLHPLILAAEHEYLGRARNLADECGLLMPHA